MVFETVQLKINEQYFLIVTTVQIKYALVLQEARTVQPYIKNNLDKTSTRN